MSFDYRTIQNTPLWENIRDDIEKGKIFLSPRIKSDRITIYYKGKLFLQYDKNGFSINYKHTFLHKIRKQEQKLHKKNKKGSWNGETFKKKDIKNQ